MIKHIINTYVNEYVNEPMGVLLLASIIFIVNLSFIDAISFFMGYVAIYKITRIQ